MSDTLTKEDTAPWADTTTIVRDGSDNLLLRYHVGQEA